MSTSPMSLRRSYFIFAIVSSGLLMASIDATIVAVALPAMLKEMKTSLALVSWTITAYQLTQTIAFPIAGKLADKWGRKRVFLCAVVLFSVGSAGAGLSPNIYVLIVFRALQAAGGGMFFPSAAGVVGEIFLEGRQTAIGLFVTIFQLGGIIGPNVGGVITDNLSWRWIFFVNLPVGLLILALGIVFMPRDRERGEESKQPLDTKGAALFAGGMFGVLFGLTYMANHPDRLVTLTPWLCIGAGLAVLAAFLRNETRAPEPIVDLKLLRWRPFFASNIQIFMSSGSFNGFFNFVPYYVTIAYGFSATQSGAILTPRSIAAVVVSVIGSVFILRVGYRLPWIVGSLMLASCMIFMSLNLYDVSVLGLHISNFLMLSAILAFGGLGLGLSGPASQNAHLDLLPDKLASAAGFRAMFANSGAVFGVTLVTLALSQYDDKVAGMQHIFFALACVIIISQAWVFLVPDTAKQRGREGQIRAVEASAAGLE